MTVYYESTHSHTHTDTHSHSHKNNIVIRASTSKSHLNKFLITSRCCCCCCCCSLFLSLCAPVIIASALCILWTYTYIISILYYYSARLYDGSRFSLLLACTISLTMVQTLFLWQKRKLLAKRYPIIFINSYSNSSSSPTRPRPQAFWKH